MMLNPFTTYMEELKITALKEGLQEQFVETALPIQIGKLFWVVMAINRLPNLETQMLFMHNLKKDIFTE